MQRQRAATPRSPLFYYTSSSVHPKSINCGIFIPLIPASNERYCEFGSCDQTQLFHKPLGTTVADTGRLHTIQIFAVALIYPLTVVVP